MFSYFKSFVYICNMTKEDFTKRLIEQYPDAIVCDGDVVQFEETVGNFVDNFMADYDEKYQKGLLGTTFENPEDCYYFFSNNLYGLLEACQDYVWSHKN